MNANGNGAKMSVTESTRQLMRAAITEDIGPGDITSSGSLEVKRIKAVIVAKSTGVISGLDCLKEVFQMIDPANEVTFAKKDGDRFDPGDEIVRLEGFNNTLLMAERTALNFLGHLSGVASLTSLFAQKIKHTKTVILDTRKTTPAMRLLEKKAVVDGGGQNHRLGLYDMFLIKDNHIAAAGSITQAVKNCKEYLNAPGFLSEIGIKPDQILIEVEITSETELKEAIETGIDRLLLDNQSTEMLTSLVQLAHKLDPRVKLEASGNVNLETVALIAETGVDFISVGAITHSAPGSDFSMRVVKETDERQSD